MLKTILFTTLVSVNAFAASDAEILGRIASCQLPNPVVTAGKLNKGFEAVSYDSLSLVALTKNRAYFYGASCDICAELYECNTSSGNVKQIYAGHSAECRDLPALSSDIVYSSCQE